MSVENQKERLLENHLPTVSEIISLTDKLRRLINDSNPGLIEIPGQGRTWASDINLPDGKEIQLGWSRIRDEYGALVWTEDGEKLKNGNYNVMYVDPYNEDIRLAEFRTKEEKVLGIQWSSIQKIMAVPQDAEEIQLQRSS